MYEPFFQLQQRPFRTGPSAARYFPAAAIEQARQSLSRCIQRAQGTGLLIGPTGNGKTLLCNVLAQQFRGTHRVVLLAGAKLCTRRALLQNILFELGLPYRDLAEGALRLTLLAHLEPAADASAGMLLIVDEADTLPVRLLEEVRMLTNIVRDGIPRVQLVLAGNATLEERLANPRLESFNQRIAARCYLQAFSRDETFNFIAWQVQVAGGELPRVFDRSALSAAHQATDGIPRLINQVCDYALHAAAASGQQPVTGANIALAWSELQQIPSPWSSHAAPTAPANQSVTPSVVEFGTLDDLPTLAGDSLASFEPFAAESVTVPVEVDEQFVEPDLCCGSFVVHELPPEASPAEAQIAATIGAELPLDLDDPRPVISLSLVGEDFTWPVIPAPLAYDTEFSDRSNQLPESAPELRIVRADVTEAVEPVESPANLEPAESSQPVVSEQPVEPVAATIPAAPFEPRHRKQFSQLFSRLRRRRSA